MSFSNSEAIPKQRANWQKIGAEVVEEATGKKLVGPRGQLAAERIGFTVWGQKSKTYGLGLDRVQINTFPDPEDPEEDPERVREYGLEHKLMELIIAHQSK